MFFDYPPDPPERTCKAKAPPPPPVVYRTDLFSDYLKRQKIIDESLEPIADSDTGIIYVWADGGTKDISRIVDVLLTVFRYGNPKPLDPTNPSHVSNAADLKAMSSDLTAAIKALPDKTVFMGTKLVHLMRFFTDGTVVEFLIEVVQKYKGAAWDVCAVVAAGKGHELSLMDLYDNYRNPLR